MTRNEAARLRDLENVLLILIQESRSAVHIVRQADPDLGARLGNAARTAAYVLRSVPVKAGD